jgi:hypothetical protein
MPAVGSENWVVDRTLSSYFAYSIKGHHPRWRLPEGLGRHLVSFVNGTDTYLFGESLVAHSAPEAVWFAEVRL